MNNLIHHLKQNKFLYFLIALLVILVLGSIRYSAYADDKQPVDPITSINNQINENDLKMKENSKEYADLDQKNAELTFQLTGNQARQEVLNSGNNALRDSNAQLNKDKSNLIAGK